MNNRLMHISSCYSVFKTRELEIIGIRVFSWGKEGIKKIGMGRQD